MKTDDVIYVDDIHMDKRDFETMLILHQRKRTKQKIIRIVSFVFIVIALFTVAPTFMPSKASPEYILYLPFISNEPVPSQVL